MNSRERITAFLEGNRVDRLPVMPITMMFAADEICKPYREYVSDYRVLVEGQIRTAARFDFDFVSCISDPVREASDCGAKIEFFDDQPPAVNELDALLADRSQLKQLQLPNPHESPRMCDRLAAAKLFRQRVGNEKYIEGWIEGPCAEAADLRGINTLMMDFYDDPDFVRELFEFVVEMELQFAAAQMNAGVDIIGIGDAAASLIGPRLYQDFVWPYEKRLVDGIHQLGGRVRLHICGNTVPLLEAMGQLQCDIVDLDYFSSLKDARRAMGDKQVLLGNLDPVRMLRDGDAAQIRTALAKCYEEAGPRYIVGAGCEIPRGTASENVLALSAFAREAN